MHVYAASLRTLAFRDIPRKNVTILKLTVVDMQIALFPCRTAALKISYKTDLSADMSGYEKDFLSERIGRFFFF